MTARDRIVVIGLVIALVGFPFQAQGDDAPAPLYPRGKKELDVVSIKRIWSSAPHNAFPGLHFFQGKWFVSLREGTAHGETGFGKVRIISSSDGDNWKSAALFDGFGDYRSGSLSVTPDNRLMIISKFNAFAAAGTAEKKVISAVDHQGQTHEVVIASYEDRVAFSKDGAEWTSMQPLHGTAPRSWLWGGVEWRNDVGYAIDRQLGGRSTLYQTTDGLHFEPVSKEVPAGNESRLAFLPDRTMVAFFRDGSLATSPAPYQKWSLNPENKNGGTGGNDSHAGPAILALHSGDVWAACRYRLDDRQGFDLPSKEKHQDGTALFKLVGEKLVPKLLIPGGGDRGYSGLAARDGFVWMAYNAPSKQADGRSSIYFAKIKLLK